MSIKPKKKKDIIVLFTPLGSGKIVQAFLLKDIYLSWKGQFSREIIGFSKTVVRS